MASKYTGMSASQIAASQQNQANLEAFYGSSGYGGAGAQNNAFADAMLESARIQSEASQAGTAAQSAAAAQALEWQKEQRALNEASLTAATEAAVAGLNPWRESGLDALGQLTEKLTAGPGEFTTSPGYEFRLAEGQKAIERSAAARGGVLSGRALQGIESFAQDTASQEYGNFLNQYYQSLAPLQQMSGQGANAAQAQGGFQLSGAAALAGAGQTSVNQMGQAAIYGGETTAAGLTDVANINAATQNALAEYQTAYDAWKAGAGY